MKKLIRQSDHRPNNAPGQACGRTFAFRLTGGLNPVLCRLSQGLSHLNFDALASGRVAPELLPSACASAIKVARNYFAQ